jgi:F-type H+-transporting ATPase subunit epsilon
MKTLKLKILTPEGPVFDGNVRSVVAPATKGSMGVLPGHANLVTSLETGVVKAEFEDGSTHYFMVSGGFLEVSKDEVRILAEVGEEDAAIDVARATEAAERAKQRLRDRRAPDFDLARAEAALARALVRVKVGELRKYRAGGQGPARVG